MSPAKKTIAVVGSRGWEDRELLEFALERLAFGDLSRWRMVSGAAGGADSMAAAWAKRVGLELEEIPADWSKGRNAGFVRNALIVGKADGLVAFWDGKSRGTAHSIGLAEKKGIPVLKIIKGGVNAKGKKETRDLQEGAA
jgi:hypothetical protein